MYGFVCLHLCVLVSDLFVYLLFCTLKQQIWSVLLFFPNQLFVLLRKVTCLQFAQLLV